MGNVEQMKRHTDQGQQGCYLQDVNSVPLGETMTDAIWSDG